ncbi:uncharacterized protein LOC110028403 [Phalaenopsis equestris]|uniref:uncharacterized protein LOC110028403 n=1 Tax=Phalaenopsis equestris TaxID=78828 RepID=UPI0009E2BA0D|nr:uncharacterized protein LOC110028403 [Phalaenopsis equestris]
METHPANRLPEADALPDGFVESSSEVPLSVNSHDSLRDRPGELGDGSPAFRTSADALRSDGVPKSEEGITSIGSFTDSFAVKVVDVASSHDYKEMELIQDTGPCYRDEQEHCQSSVQGCLELHSCTLKESHTDDTESLTYQNKQVSFTTYHFAGSYANFFGFLWTFYKMEALFADSPNCQKLSQSSREAGPSQDRARKRTRLFARNTWSGEREGTEGEQKKKKLSAVYLAGSAAFGRSSWAASRGAHGVGRGVVRKKGPASKPRDRSWPHSKKPKRST